MAVTIIKIFLKKNHKINKIPENNQMPFKKTAEKKTGENIRKKRR